MGDLSKNFDRVEFACRGKNCCGHSAPVHPDLIDALQQLRDLLGRPVRIISGFRCRTHNAAIGGAKDSFHTLGMAADVECLIGVDSRRLALLAECVGAFDEGGIGVYPSWVHLDVRRGRARWEK